MLGLGMLEALVGILLITILYLIICDAVNIHILEMVSNVMVQYIYGCSMLIKPMLHLVTSLWYRYIKNIVHCYHDMNV